MNDDSSKVAGAAEQTEPPENDKDFTEVLLNQERHPFPLVAVPPRSYRIVTEDVLGAQG